MNRPWRVGLPGLLLVFPLAFPLMSRGADPEPAAVDRIFAQYDHTNTPGCALGVFRDGRVIYSRGYGMADLNQGTPITPATVFYIASTSKQFTAMSIALLAEQGKISLDDPVRKWVPELPAYADKVTIRHLVHHTSGIRDYLGLWGLSGRSVADEIPEEAALDLISRQRAVDFEPGSRFSYSNSGYFLLSVVVKRASGQSLRQYDQANMFGPLGMTDTHFHDDATQIVARRAEGYQPSPKGGFDIVKTSFAGVGDGGLLTTVLDLQRWDENFYANRLGTRGQALIDQVTTVGHLNSGDAQTYAFGLMPSTYRGVPMITHGGSFIGFRAELMRLPVEHFSVAILCNDYTADPSALAKQVADLYLTDKLAPVAAAGTTAGATVPVERLDRWVGRYELMPGLVARVTRSAAGLSAAAFGTTFPLVATDDSTFTLAGSPSKVEFRMTATGPAMIPTWLGINEPSTRLADMPALTSALAASYAGRYRSEELDTWSDVQARGDTVQVRTRWGAWTNLEPMARDRFSAAGARVEFDRDKAGRVTGYRVSQARTRNVGFSRVR